MSKHLQAAHAFDAYLARSPKAKHFRCINDPLSLNPSVARKVVFSPQAYHWVDEQMRWYDGEKPVVAEGDIFGVLIKEKHTRVVKGQWSGTKAIWEAVFPRYSGISYLDVQTFLQLWRDHELRSEPMSEAIMRLMPLRARKMFNLESLFELAQVTQDWSTYSVTAQSVKVAENQAYLFSVRHWLKIAEAMRLPRVWTPPGSPLGVGDCQKADADLIVLVWGEVPEELALDPGTTNKLILIVRDKTPSLLPSSPSSSHSATERFLGCQKDHATIDVQDPSLPYGESVQGL